MKTCLPHISHFNIIPLKKPLLQSFRTALGDHDQLDNFLVEMVLSDGTRGWGEAALAGHITGEKRDVINRQLKKVAQWIEGWCVADYVEISNQLHTRWGKHGSLIASVEVALFDCLSQTLNVPLWKLFGSSINSLKTDITIVIADLSETRASIVKFRKQGFTSFKVKIGRDFDLDMKRVLSVDEMIPGAEIILDANQGYSAKETLLFIAGLKKHGVTPVLLEQPVPCEDYEGLCRVTHSVKIPVCADESARSLHDVIRIIKDKAADVINIKLMKFGMVHGYHAARLVKSAGLDLMIGGMMETSIAMTAAAHMAVGIGSIKYVDLDTPFFIKNEVSENPYLTRNGIYRLSKTKPGLGLMPIK